jgi:hypothetical protein
MQTVTPSNQVYKTVELRSGGGGVRTCDRLLRRPSGALPGGQVPPRRWPGDRDLRAQTRQTREVASGELTRRSILEGDQEVASGALPGGRPPGLQAARRYSVSVAQRGEPCSQDPDRTDDTDLVASRGTRPRAMADLMSSRSTAGVRPFRRPPEGSKRPAPAPAGPETPAGGPEAARCHWTGERGSKVLAGGEPC